MGSEALQHLRRVTLCLIVSGSFNIVLLTAIFYLLFRESPPKPYYEAKPAAPQEQQVPLALDRSNAELIRQFRGFSLDRLIAILSNTQLVENGYSQRDLALAALTTFHHFDLPRSLLGFAQPTQHREVIYGRRQNGSPATLTVYPGLSDAQYGAILRFAQTERWPLTPKGLFLLLQKESISDPTLADAFFVTPEFMAVRRLFNTAQAAVENKELLEMLMQGNWQMLADFYQGQRQSQDLSAARRQRFLLDYMDRNSTAAARLMLRTDGGFALQKLADKHVLQLLSLMDPSSPETEQFAASLMKSPRKDTVLEAASAKLNKRMVLSPQTILQKEMPLQQVKAPPLKTSNVYVVQEGDSLWKISRRFHVDIDAIKTANNLTSDILRPGRTLQIPTGSNGR